MITSMSITVFLKYSTNVNFAKVYLEPSRKSTMDLFWEIVNT